MYGRPFYLNELHMYYVYILKSIKDSKKIYVGYTTSLENRLDMHNHGKSAYTAKYKPWKLISYVALESESRAIAFEKYLKGGSGKAFAKNHLL